MGLFSSKNKSSNTTTNNVDNSAINLNNGGVGTRGDNNTINITDGGAFDLVSELIEEQGEGTKVLADAMKSGYEEFVSGVGGVSSMAFETTGDIARDAFESNNKAIEQISKTTDSAFEFGNQQSEQAYDVSVQALSAVADSNRQMTEHYEEIAKISSGDTSGMVTKIVIALSVVGGLFAVSKMVK